MFEKVLARRRDRRGLLHSRAVWASVAAHVVLVSAIVLAPRGAAHTVASAEVATMLLLYQATPAPPQQFVRSEAPRRILRSMPRRGVPLSAPRGSTDRAPREVVELALNAPRVVPDLTLATSTSGSGKLDPAILIGRGRAGMTVDSAVGPRGHPDGEVPVVDAELLAEAPSILNPREMSARLGRLYPVHFAEVGIEGEVVVMFIIGTNGRAEMDSAVVVSATNQGFVSATLRGLSRMRFRPARLNGLPVRVRVTLPVTWTLPDP